MRVYDLCMRARAGVRACDVRLCAWVLTVLLMVLLVALPRNTSQHNNIHVHTHLAGFLQGCMNVLLALLSLRERLMNSTSVVEYCTAKNLSSGENFAFRIFLY